jgi:uncharacterized protein YndB with AHSA1/START domain
MNSREENLQLTKVPSAQTGMLIRRPVSEVFEAIVNPEITTKFWFTRSSGRLEVGTPIRWDWEMYDVSIRVTATVIDPNRRVVYGVAWIRWTDNR